MVNSKIGFVDESEGWGFIETDETAENVFFEVDDVDGSDFHEGQDVEFDIDQSENRDNEFKPDLLKSLDINLNVNEPNVRARGLQGKGL